jgi:UDP-4-amino-4,6-dideoxy-N-acetyl-beta-L-altrosamine transaminase
LNPERSQLSYGRQWINDEDIQAVCDVLRGDWLTSGPAVKRFEGALAEYCGAKYAVAVCNGTAALHAACAALDIKAGSVGVTSGLSFLASANCVAYGGGRPDFADVDPKTYCLSPVSVEEYIHRHGIPAVVIPVDFAGVPADLPAFRALADRHGIRLIEDAAHSVGSAYTDGGRMYRCGGCAHTDLAILSFHPVKTITSGEGGMVLTNDPVLAKRVRMFCNHGTEREAGGFVPWGVDSATGHVSSAPLASADSSAPWLYQQQMLGYNFRITDIQCALGLSQFNRLETFKARRAEIVRAYNDAFAGDARFVTPPCPPHTDPAFHLYILRLTAPAPDARLRMARHLREKGILAQVHYVPIYLHPWYRQQYGYAPGKCPQTETVYNSCLSLPLYPMMTDEDVQHVIQSVKVSKVSA